MSWLDVHSFKNATLGYIFCCSVEEALQKITHFPVLPAPKVKIDVSFETYDSNEGGMIKSDHGHFGKNEDYYKDFSDDDYKEPKLAERKKYDERKESTGRRKSSKHTSPEDEDYESAESEEESSYEQYLKLQKRFENKKAH
jgi:hypothetical protein